MCIRDSFLTASIRIFSVAINGSSSFKCFSIILGYTTSPLTIDVYKRQIEEFAMRGVVMQSLRKYGDWFAIIMSSLVLALVHGNMVQIPFAFIAGIAIGYAVTVTGSMWTGV